MAKPFQETWRAAEIKIRGRIHFCVCSSFVDTDGQRGGRLVADCGVDLWAKGAADLIAAQFNAGSAGSNP